MPQGSDSVAAHDRPPSTGRSKLRRVCWNRHPTRVLRGWHGQDWMYVRAFVEAHAEYLKILIEGTRDGSGFFEHYYQENFSLDPDGWPMAVCDGVTPGGRLNWSGARCIVVRGDDWQKDTLPAPAICTQLITLGGPDRPSYEG